LLKRMPEKELLKSEVVFNALNKGAKGAKAFFRSMTAGLIGLAFFILVGPALIFSSEFSGEKDRFDQAMPAIASEPANGYVYIWGKAEAVAPVKCPILTRKSCIFFDYSKLKYVDRMGELCGEKLNDQDVERLFQMKDRCFVKKSGEGENAVQETVCERCWKAKWKEWNVVEEQRSALEFNIGANRVKGEKAAFKNVRRYEGKEFQVKGERYREVLEYIDDSQEILVVGLATDGFIWSGDPFMVSTKPYEATSKQVEREEDNSPQMLKVAGALCLLLGMALILSAITELIDIFESIPNVGEAFIGLSRIRSKQAIVLSIVVSAVLRRLFWDSHRLEKRH